jgi:hypothetical protein
MSGLLRSWRPQAPLRALSPDLRLDSIDHPDPLDHLAGSNRRRAWARQKASWIEPPSGQALCRRHNRPPAGRRRNLPIAGNPGGAASVGGHVGHRRRCRTSLGAIVRRTCAELASRGAPLPGSTAGIGVSSQKIRGDPWMVRSYSSQRLVSDHAARFTHKAGVELHTQAGKDLDLPRGRRLRCALYHAVGAAAASIYGANGAQHP